MKQVIGIIASWVFVAVVFLAAPVNAAPLGYGGFSGSETRIDFDHFTFTNGVTPQTFSGVTFAGAGGFSTSSVPILFSNFASSTPPASLGNSGVADNPSTDMTITFSTPVNRVGILLAEGPIDSWTMLAYGSSGTSMLLGSDTKTESTGGQSVFIGLMFSQNIQHIEIIEQPAGIGNGNDTFFDDLRFEATPEPASFALLAVGSMMVLGRRRRVA